MRKRLVLTTFLVAALLALTGITTAAEAPTLYNNTPIYASLAGSHGGAFWYAVIDYQGGGDVITLTLNFTPADPVTSLGVGFNVYGPKDGILVGVGKPTPSNAAGVRTWQYANDEPQRLLVQVYNYIEGVTADTKLEGVGLQAAPLYTEPVLSGGMTGVWGGSFARYTITYDQAEPVTLVMSYSPSDSIIRRGVNFRIYGPEGQVAIGSPTDTEGQVAATFTPTIGTKYLVQVENYIPGAAINYSFGSSLDLVPVQGGW